MKVYDCFMFFNELDLLELRLEELYNSVDFFVIAESNVTHSGNKKDYMLLNNYDRFKKYHSKIRHIKVEDMPENVNGMYRDSFQRRAISRGLYDLTNEDFVILSDLDEIPRAELIDMIINDQNSYDRYLLNIPQFRHRLNFMKVKETYKYTNIIVTRGSIFTDPQTERDFTYPWSKKPENSVELEHGGWHFTWLGNNEQVINKLTNFAHTELNNDQTVSNINIDSVIQDKKSFLPNQQESFEYVQVDDYFPKYIRDNIAKWSNLIIPDADKSVYDIYKE